MQIQLSGYRVLRLLGSGGMGTVFEVEELASGTQLALKVLGELSPSRLRRFKWEFRSVAELTHPNIVRLLELKRQEQTWFFTMERIHGSDLLSSHGVFSDRDDATRSVEALEESAVEIPNPYEPGPPLTHPPSLSRCNLELLRDHVLQLVDALDCLHAAGIVHRDLKPQNVLVDPQGVVKLLDFGLAYAEASERPDFQRGLGTPAYMAPEQLTGEAIGPATDLYALGILIFQAISGQLPFQGGASQSAGARLRLEPPSLDRLVTDVPDHWVQLCHRLMNPSPGLRPTIAGIREALGDVGQARSRSERDFFVGRVQELEALCRLWSEVSGGAFHARLMTGGSGMGKTTLAQQLAREVRRMEGHVFLGRSYDRESIPFRAFDAVADQVALLLDWGIIDRNPALGRSMEDAARLFPVLGAPMPSPTTEDNRGTYQLWRDGIEGLCALLEGMAEGAPLLIVLDDLQWIDADSAEVVRMLLQRSARRVLLLGLARPEALDGDHRIGMLMKEQRALVPLSLSPLGSETLQGIVSQAAGPLRDPGLLEACVTASRGSPLFARQLGEAVRTSSYGMGEGISLHRLVAHNLQELSPEAQQVLTCAAAAGEPCNSRLLQRVTGLETGDLQLSLRELTSRRFFTRMEETAGRATPHAPGSGEVRYEASHAAFAETAYAALGEDARLTLHGRIAQGLIDLREGTPTALYHHLSAAGQPAAAAPHRFEAACRAEERLALDQAIRLFDQAARDASLEPRLSFEARLRHASLIQRSGDAGGTMRVARELVEVIEASSGSSGLPPPYDQPERLRALLVEWRAQQALGEALSGRLQAAMDTTERIAATFGHRLRVPTWRRMIYIARLTLHLGIVYALPSRWTQRPATHMDRLRVHHYTDVAMGIGSSESLIAVEYHLRRLLLQSHWRGEAGEEADRALGAVILAMGAAGRKGLLDRSQREAERALEAVRVLGDPIQEAIVAGLRSIVLVQAWRLEEASIAARDALEVLGRQVVRDRDMRLIEISNGLLCYLRGEDQALLDATVDALVERDHFRRMALGHVRVMGLLRLGQLEAAERLAEGWEDLIRDHPLDNARYFYLQGRLQLCLARGNFLEALELNDRWEAAFQRSPLSRWASFRAFWYWPVTEALAAARRNGEIDARQHARTINAARRSVRRVHEPTAQPYLLRALALLEHALGRRRSAQQYANQALRITQQLKLPHQRQLAIAAAHTVGASTPELDAELCDLETRYGYIDYSSR